MVVTMVGRFLSGKTKTTGDPVIMSATSFQSDCHAPSALDMNLLDRVCVGDMIQRGADVYPHHVAIVDGDRQVTYETFNTQVNQLGHALLGLGLKHQDVVALAARNSLEVLLTYFACARAGLICMPVNLGLRPNEIVSACAMPRRVC